MVTLGAALVALLSGNPPLAALQSSASVSPATMPAIATIDDRFESYNVEMAEVIGGKFWKPYDAATLASLKAKVIAAKTGSSASLVIGEGPSMSRYQSREVDPRRAGIGIAAWWETTVGARAPRSDRVMCP
jgi:hypothetical protein